MELSLTTDYVTGLGDPSPYLRRIAEAGFTHVHWCHQWNTDFVYSAPEVRQIHAWLTDFGLRLLDLHGAVGPRKNWASPREDQRLAGVDLVRNRLQMTAQLGGGVTIMHVPPASPPDAVRRSLDALEPIARADGVRIAIENGDFATIRPLLAAYPPDYLGLCYDCGHGNVDGDGLDNLDALKNRLISIHLHDNDGTADLHNPLFTGTVDWPRLASILAASAYTGPVSMEVTLPRSGFDDNDETPFLRHVLQTGTRLSEMIDEQRKPSS